MNDFKNDDWIKWLDEELKNYQELKDSWWTYQYATKKPGEENQFDLAFQTFLILRKDNWT